MYNLIFIASIESHVTLIEPPLFGCSTLMYVCNKNNGQPILFHVNITWVKQDSGGNILLSAAESAAQAEIIYRLCACYRIPLAASLFINFRLSVSKTKGKNPWGPHSNRWIWILNKITAPRNEWPRFQNRNNKSIWPAEVIFLCTEIWSSHMQRNGMVRGEKKRKTTEIKARNGIVFQRITESPHLQWQKETQ